MLSDAVEHPLMHGRAQCNRKLAGPGVSSAEAEKPGLEPRTEEQIKHLML